MATIVYKDGERPQSSSCAAGWFDALPDHRNDSHPPEDDALIPDDLPLFFVPPTPAAPNGVGLRLTRITATLNAVYAIVLRFPTFPQPPMERHLIDEKIDIIQILCGWAMEPDPTDEDVKEWESFLEMVNAAEGVV